MTLDTIRRLIQENQAYLVVMLVFLFFFAALHRWVWWGHTKAGMAVGMWLLVGGIFVAGALFSAWATDRADQGIRQLLEGYAPTYAREMQHLGHEKITLDTSPADPDYLRMNDSLKRWVEQNPAASDIYTIRKVSDGSFALMVDAETDYDRNGRFEGAREQRTAIGEAYGGDLVPALEQAMKGRKSFTPNPYTDRWGTWVSSVMPIYDAQGKVDAVLGVDYDGQAWVAAGRQAKVTWLAYISVALLLLAISSVFVVHYLDERTALRNQILAQSGIRAEKKKLEILVNSLEEIVWEFDAKSNQFTFISQQSEKVLGYLPEDWIADSFLWDRKLHPGDRWALAESERMISLKNPYSLDYRMIAADGGTVWIRESGAVQLDEAGEPQLVCGTYRDITAWKAAAQELEKTHQKLLQTSRQAGMAEIATGVLHNVGNILNSVNVSASIVAEKLQQSKASQLEKLAALLTSKDGAIPEYLARDPDGRKIPEYLGKLGQHLVARDAEIFSEIEQLRQNIRHINKIVATQQGYAKMSGALEILPLAEIVEDALAMNLDAFHRQGITVERDFSPSPSVPVDRHKTLLILVNLFRNAKHALVDCDHPHKALRISIYVDQVHACIAIADNGIGIPRENMGSIFRHGFTTRENGHGFGLHSCANAAAEMGGTLGVESSGAGHGATFTLKLPLVKPTTSAA